MTVTMGLSIANFAQVLELVSSSSARSLEFGFHHVHVVQNILNRNVIIDTLKTVHRAITFEISTFSYRGIGIDIDIDR